MSKSNLNRITFLLMLLLPAFSFAQGITNNGAAIIVNGTSTTTSNVYININGTTGNYLNTGTGVINCTNIGYDVNADGSATSNITVGGNWTNNGSTTGITGNGLTTIFNNATATQTIGGTSATTFFNLICQGLGKTFSASSSAFAVQVNQNFSVSSAVTYSNISSILIGKSFMGNSSINSGSLPVTIGDDYLNTATGYNVTGNYTYNGSAASASPLIVGALNYNNLNILSSDGVTKAAPVNGTTTVSGILTVADKCTLQANGNLTLLSTASGTASIAALTGTANITGNVNVQRFVTGSYGRSYRLISSPVYNSTSFYTIASLINNTPITGPNPGTGSFDASNTNNASIWMYREGDPFPANTVIKDSDYKGIYSLTENIPVGTGLLFFNRGSRTNLTTKLRGPVFPTPDDNAIVFTGVPNQGTINVKVPQNNINNFTVSSPYVKESPGSSVQSAYYYKYNSSYPPVANLLRTNWYGTSGKTGDQGSDGFNLIGNPYASTIDIDQVTFGTDVSPLVYVYNPATKQFSYYSKGSATSGSAVTDGNGASRYIASGEGFFAKCNVVGSTNAGVTFAESNKVSTQLTSSTSPLLLMSAHIKGEPNAGQFIMGAPVSNGLDLIAGVTSKLMLQLKTDSVNYDGIGLFFNKNLSANYDKEDASDLDGITPSVYLSSYSNDNVRLAINKMPTVNKEMRIRLFIDATSTANQQLRITDMANIAPKYNVYVIDHHQKDSLLLNQNNAYNFKINNADTTTNGGNRLELVFKINPDGIYKLLTFIGEINNRSIVLNWTTKNEAGYTVFTVEKSTDGGKTFLAIGSVAANNTGSYTYTDNDAENGSVIYRLKQTVLDDTSYSDQVKINFNALNIASFYVYPNPASSYIQLNSPQVIKGNAEIRIINMTGSTVLKSTENSNNALRMDVTSLMPGVYVVELTDANKKVIGRAKFIKN
ncbi:T9SS type A sorting domain-containing protein [Mucilaginibacter arboris]|uniref:T9SS type A sorting domain-containing protein n=1 Tax=Mucilaginibacter arboris TaxID=2682090 RepID=A0A7K1SWY3_9SPHI|nr:T9SS type A sorting domain-containing protein [Mucilaginibacter arboris]MVN21822.1 T9SS type A sorting domain-containing protein [Mucilaginibacter arboris]